MSYKKPEMQNLSYFYDSCLSNLMISLYTSILMPLGFPPPRPVKLVLDTQTSYEDFTEMAQGIISLPKSLFIKRIYNRTKKSSILTLVPVSLKFLGRSIGYNDYESQLHLKSHQLRFYLLRISTDISFLSIYLAVLTITPIFLFIYFSKEWIFENSKQLSILGVLVYTSSLIVIYVVPALLILRILFAISRRLLAESLCVQEVMHIIFDLSRDDVLTKSDRKYLLLNRIDYLSSLNILISRKYSDRKNKINQEWVEKHFKAISFYIEERGRWIFTPTEDTLAILREDFINLADLYITGRYGEFDWNTVNISAVNIPLPTRQKILVDRFIRLLGIGIPLVVLGGYIILPNELIDRFFPGVTVSKDNVTYILLAWLLITIDITLQLGVVKSLIEFAKGLKDLNN